MFTLNSMEQKNISHNNNNISLLDLRLRIVIHKGPSKECTFLGTWPVISFLNGQL